MTHMVSMSAVELDQEQQTLHTPGSTAAPDLDCCYGALQQDQ